MNFQFIITYNFTLVLRLTIVKLNAPLKIVNGAITSSNLIGAFSTSISVDAFNAF
jgi:hypothetical protein